MVQSLVVFAWSYDKYVAEKGLGGNLAVAEEGKTESRNFPVAPWIWIPVGLDQALLGLVATCLNAEPT